MATRISNSKYNHKYHANSNKTEPHQANKVAMGNRIADYEVKNLLGRGAFACVYQAKCKISNRDVAIKVIDKKTMRKSGMVSRVRNEVEIQAQLKHKSILELYHCFEDNMYVYLVLELCLEGELSCYLKRNGRMHQEQGW